MRRRVEQTDQAESDLDHHFDYLAERNLQAARRLLKEASKAYRMLLRMPFAGTACELNIAGFEDLRFWPIVGFENYVIYYRPVPTGVKIVRVFHAAQDHAAILQRMRQT